VAAARERRDVESSGDELLCGAEVDWIDVFFVECIVDFEDHGDEM
jgi:hypothetical protein